LIELEFRVRWYQRAFHEALVQRTHDRLMAIWHRRAGKDEIVLSAIAELSEKEIGTYWHCFPEYKQARKAIWNGINPHTGKRRIFDHFPEPIIKRMQDDDMFIELAVRLDVPASWLGQIRRNGWVWSSRNSLLRVGAGQPKRMGLPRADA
jgi:hypothetical protein